MGGIVTPPLSARSGLGLNAAGAEGHSLEVSASVDTRSMDTEFNKSLGLLSDRKGSSDGKSMDKAVGNQGVPKSWQELGVDLDVLAEALKGIRSIRAKQREFLTQLKLAS